MRGCSVVRRGPCQRAGILARCLQGQGDSDFVSAVECTCARQDARVLLRTLHPQHPDDPRIQQVTQQCQQATAEVRRIKRARWARTKTHWCVKSQKHGASGILLRLGRFHVCWVEHGSGPKSGTLPFLPLFFANKIGWSSYPCRAHKEALPQPSPELNTPILRPHEGTFCSRSRLSRSHSLHYTKLRRAPPPWSFPAAARRTFLERSSPTPSWHWRVASPPQLPESSKASHSQCYAQACRQRAESRDVGTEPVPSQHLSITEQGLSGQQLLHTLERQSLFFPSLEADAKSIQQALRHTNRRREQATAFYDLANAFASASHAHTLANRSLPNRSCAESHHRSMSKHG